MTTKQGDAGTANRRTDLLWLTIAFGLGVFSNGRWIMPLTTWLASVFFLRFTHSRRPLPGLLLPAP